MKISYNWLKWYIPEIPEASKLEELFTYHLCEVEGIEKREDGDVIFDINILPNRAHDLLSHQGVAKELSGLLGIAYNDPTPMYKIPESKPTELKVEIMSPSCRRYSARIVRGVKVGPSPEWVVKHLESIGEKSINNIVDATNIVMYDCGNPTHAFDLRKSGTKIKIQNAKEGEGLELLGSEKKKVSLKETDLVIADGDGNTLAIAGVKGGTNSGIGDDTTDIVLEVANFDPVSVRKTARRIGILSDAAKRFENDLTPEHASYAMRELSGLMLEVFPDAVFEDVVDIYPVRQEERQITFTAPFISKKLGVEIGGDEIEKILKNYTFVYERNDESFTITPSHLRLDLQIPEDMVEEIGRVIGYDRALPILPAKNKEVVHSEEFLKIQAVRNHLLSLGYNEVKTYAFRKKGDVEVARGVGDKSALRKNLTDGIKESYELNRLNAPLLGLSEVKIFEIGTIFTKDGEFVHVATADKKGVIENTLDEFWKTIDNSHVTFDSNKNGVNSQWSHVKSFKMWSQYPFITRDIAFWLGGNTSQEDIEKLLNENKNALVVKGPTLIDSFTKDGRTSLAYRFVFQSYEKTLTDEEVGGEMEKITKTLESLGCEIR